MAKGILGKKIGMTQLFDEGGSFIPVTFIEAGPCPVIEVRSIEKHGYSAIQLGFEDKGNSRMNNAQEGRFKKLKIKPKKFIGEIPVTPEDKYEVGQAIDVDIFSIGDFVDIQGVSIGKGFQGGMKRWNWSGGPKSHGSMSHRSPGSIGTSATPSRVLKGRHLPGHMGFDKKTIQNLKIIKLDKEKKLLVVKGPVPGPRNGYLIIKTSIKGKKNA